MLNELKKGVTALANKKAVAGKPVTKPVVKGQVGGLLAKALAKKK